MRTVAHPSPPLEEEPPVVMGAGAPSSSSAAAHGASLDSSAAAHGVSSGPSLGFTYLTCYLSYGVLILFGQLRDFFGRWTSCSRYKKRTPSVRAPPPPWGRFFVALRAPYSISVPT